MLLFLVIIIQIIDIEKTNNEIQKENYQKELEAHKQKIEEYNKVLTEKEQLENIVLIEVELKLTKILTRNF